MIGQKVNNYKMTQLLGEGGMGAVYLAEHPFLGRKAAIKILKPECASNADYVQRFLNQARAANAIHHPNIIDIIDVGLLPLIKEFVEHYLAERFHQGIEGQLIKGEAGSANDNGAIARRSRLGGFLNYYHREAA